MPEGLNISTGIGEGDANVLHWGAVDKAADRLYQEQLRRKALAQQQYQMQQAQFQKELGQVRSVDIPEVVDAYNKRKAITQQLYFDKNLQKDPVKYAQAQLQAKQADAEYYGLVNGSRETLAGDVRTSDNIVKNHDLYDKGASGTLSQWLQMPTSARKQQGFLGEDQLLYKGANTDYGGMVKTAVGEPQEVPIGGEILTPDKLSYQTQYYKRTAQPEQIKANLIGQFDKKQAGQDAPLILSQIPKEEFVDINQRYDKIPNDQYKKLYGKDKPNLDAKNPENPVEVLASFEAKRQAVTNPPQPSKVVPRRNDAEYLRLQEEKEKRLLALRHGNSIDLLNRHIAAKKTEAKDLVGVANTYLEEVIKNANNVATEGGKTSLFGNDPAVVDDVLLKNAFKVEGKIPNQIEWKDGNFHVKFYQTYTEDNKEAGAKAGDIIKDSNGRPKLIERASGVISPKQAQTLLLKELPLTKQAIMEQFNYEAPESEIGFSWDEE